MNAGVRAAAALVLVCSATAGASEQPLSADELARCAQQVRHLRSAAPRLLQQNAQLEAQRENLMQRQRELDSAVAAADLDTHLALQDRRLQLRDAMTAHNARVETLRTEITALNGIWKHYDAQCSNRSYRRSDFERLAPEAQAAMRAGLADVQVPYIPELMTAPAGVAER